jgi:hypothetical protein
MTTGAIGNMVEITETASAKITVFPEAVIDASV